MGRGGQRPDQVTRPPKAAASPRVDVAVAILLSQGRVWIQSRRTRDSLMGCWEFPGGKLKPGESVRAGLRREVREELGLDLSEYPVELYGRASYCYPEQTVDIRFFLCRLPTPPHLSQGRWIELARLSTFRFPPANASIVRKLGEMTRNT